MSWAILLPALVATLCVLQTHARHEEWALAGGLIIETGEFTIKDVGISNKRALSVLEGTYEYAPNIEFTEFTFADGSPAAVFHDELSVHHAYFAVTIIALEKWEQPIIVKYTATLQGTDCISHDNCPISQYCDEFGGCDDCRVCSAIEDTFDGSKCPSKCFQDGISGKMVSVVHVCEKETYPCGDECFEVSGNELPPCFQPPGKAVCAGDNNLPGSMAAYQEKGLSMMTTEEIRRKKAEEALMKAEEVSAHYANPKLAKRHADIVDIGLCYTVTCEVPDQCHKPTVCHNGVCAVHPEKENGMPCNDGLEHTDEDACQDGVCVGIDYCIGVTCEAKDQCHVPGVCAHGVCSDPAASDGEVCDDGMERTDDDQCQNGECIGIDYCVANNVVCEAKDQCHIAGTCANGVCSDPKQSDGTDCDDGKEPTDNDTCQDGVCVGIDYCIGVTCEVKDQCHVLGVCSHGECSNPYKPNGTLCDDGDFMTSFDKCVTGVCEGIFQPTVGPEQELQKYETVAQILLRKASTAVTSATLKKAIVEGISGVYGEDVSVEPAVTASDGVSFDITVATRVFGKDHVVTTLNSVLDSIVSATLSGPGTITVKPHAILRCLTKAPCPKLVCGEDEVEYTTSYLSVRRCCPKCIKKDEKFTMEVKAWQEATQHWKDAQKEQDSLYETNDYLPYVEKKVVYDNEMNNYSKAAALWNQHYDTYSKNEKTFYDIVCPTS